MKATRAHVLTLTGPALLDLDSYLSQGWKLACYAWGYAYIIKSA